MNILRIFVLGTIFATLCGCGVPSYSVRGPLVVPIVIEGTDGASFIMIKKLATDCSEEAKFENAIGRNTRRINVDLIDRFSFQLLYISPQLIGCKVQNTIPLKYGNEYRILLETPKPSSPKDQLCKITLEAEPTFGPLSNKWVPNNFEGTCAINERF